MEMFYTLQGEGAHTGRAAYFIRLGGCDVGCVWCDVKDSWDATKHPTVSVENIVQQAAEFPGRLAVITGGEPLMHDLTELTYALKAVGFTINIETSGAYALSGNLDWICLSPKKFKAPLPEVIAAAHELKVVVYHKSDLSWAETYAQQVKSDCRLFLQPEWDRREQMTPLIIDYIQQHPQWQLSLQTHKWIGVP